MMGVFAENLVGLGFLQSVSQIKQIPTHEKVFAVGKRGLNATFNLIFLGLGWPWVGKFVGFIIIFTCFPTQENLVNRKHPDCGPALYLPPLEKTIVILRDRWWTQRAKQEKA